MWYLVNLQDARCNNKDKDQLQMLNVWQNGNSVTFNMQYKNKYNYEYNSQVTFKVRGGTWKIHISILHS